MSLPRSLGYRTDLIFARFDGRVTERDGYLVVATPTNPTFFWGNFLLFPAPPRAGDLARWAELFVREHPGAAHRAFGWDAPETGDVTELRAAGYHIEESVVLGADRAALRAPRHPNPDVAVRLLASEDDWAQATENQVAAREPGHTLVAYTTYVRTQMARYRAMAAQGLGASFGAFLGDRLVADLGLYGDGEVARFQNVVTHADFRRQGLCATLVAHAARWGLDVLGAHKLVMVADEHYHAARIYESLGFAPVDRQRGASWWPGRAG